MTITGPSAIAPITAPFDLANLPNPYVITWAGFATDASGNVSYLNRGDDKIRVEGVKEDDTAINTSENDPNVLAAIRNRGILTKSCTAMQQFGRRQEPGVTA